MLTTINLLLKEEEHLSHSSKGDDDSFNLSVQCYYSSGPFVSTFIATDSFKDLREKRSLQINLSFFQHHIQSRVRLF